MRRSHVPILIALMVLDINPAHGDEPGKSAQGDWLMMTQTLTRHGDRAAESDEYITKNAELAFFRGHGELSTDGIAHAKETGEAYRRVYVNKAKFINGQFNPKEVLFQSSEVSRTMMTAGAFSSGLFEAEQEVVIAPVTTVPYADDKVLALNFACKNGWEDMIEKYNLNASLSMPDQILNSMRSSEWECSDPPAAQSDTIIAEFANPLTKNSLSQKQKNCAQDPALKFMYNFIEQLGGSGTADPNAAIRLQRTVGGLANQIIDNFRWSQGCYQNRLMYCDPYAGSARFYFAHDVNMLALMNVFSNQQGAVKFFKGNTPAFASSIVMELWVHLNQQYIKMFVKNGSKADFTEFDFCQYLPNDKPTDRVGRYCTLDALEKAKNVWITSNGYNCNYVDE